MTTVHEVRVLDDATRALPPPDDVALGQWLVAFQQGTITGDVPLELHAVHTYRGLHLAVAADDAAVRSLAALAPIESVQPLHPSFRQTHHLVRALDLTTLVVCANHDPDAPPEARLYPGASVSLPIVNISLGPESAIHPFDPGDAVQMATRALSNHCLVVAAAGNSGDLGSRESMSAWAEAPWVIGVGATDDPDGTSLAGRSSRGTPDDPDSGSRLVAYGRSGLDPKRVGTSYAAPRVCFSASVVGAAFGQIRHAFEAVRAELGANPPGGPGTTPPGGPAPNGRGEPQTDGPEPEPVSLVGITFVDVFEREPWYVGAGRLPVASLPVVELQPAVRDLAAHVLRRDPTVEIAARSHLVAAVLAGAARPVPGRARHEVGVGFIDDDLIVEHLAELPASAWARLAGCAELLTDLPPAVAASPLFDQDTAQLLTDLVRATQPILLCDHRTGEIRLRPDQTPPAPQAPHAGQAEAPPGTQE